ncbi:cobalt transporter [Pleomorphomonas diazotrophica]|uniref:Cobalt transporter n=1 Tax=Pleomorphomonas diazotrophica TaxID=1166257 RepID=A0A1I4VPP7_9HYPH|nr:energy-coupling factor ABC transporter permease [Pleomorphomonas diazotrophica]PKR89566.1 cobalt transporter [Pleomorphomonas diazotrophica]SFN03037.1 Cobalt uptake substrate-specific transmembrane region [Pleomorphomonas diazotrophica]
MHIEPGLVAEGKLWLSYLTATGAAGYGSALARRMVRESGFLSLGLRSVATTALVFSFFEVLPHYPVGVSEVHLILGSTLFLLFGAAPAAIGLALGLLIQGLFFAPFDLPQYAMNVTTLLVPLFGLSMLARRVIAPATPYVELKYGQALALSTAYQAGIVGWVGFWALYGQGFTVGNFAAIGSFGGAYMLVIIVEPLVDLAVLAGAKLLYGLRGSLLVNRRLYDAA